MATRAWDSIFFAIIKCRTNLFLPFGIEVRVLNLNILVSKIRVQRFGVHKVVTLENLNFVDEFFGPCEFLKILIDQVLRLLICLRHTGSHSCVYFHRD